MNHILENHLFLVLFAALGAYTFWSWAAALCLDLITMWYAHQVRKTYPEAKLVSFVFCAERLFHVEVSEGYFLNCDSPFDAWRAAWKRIKLEEKLPK